MIRYGVPEYRMPYEQLDKDINYILSHNMIINYNTKVGKDLLFDSICKDFDAVLFSTGLDYPYKMEIIGEDLPDVIPGLQILKDVTNEIIPDIGKKVVVIGGGNVAMDSARTSRRLGAEVTILYRRREEDMPVDKEEILESHEENIEFITQAIPLKIEKGNKYRLKLIWNKAKMEHRKSGRPVPVIIEGDIHTIETDTIISAIGQGPDYSFLSENYDKKLKFRKNKVLINEFGQTSVNKIFACGDTVNSTADAISAIADGHRAAGIDRFLQQKGENNED